VLHHLGLCCWLKAVEQQQLAQGFLQAVGRECRGRVSSKASPDRSQLNTKQQCLSAAPNNPGSSWPRQGAAALRLIKTFMESSTY
jgi:hypothetical protein